MLPGGGRRAETRDRARRAKVRLALARRRREFGDAVAAARAQLSAIALDAQERALQAWRDEAPQLPGSDSPPVLAICGSEDVVIPPQNSELLAMFWPGARSECVAGGGHAFIAQQPERVAALIAGFLGG